MKFVLQSFVVMGCLSAQALSGFNYSVRKGYLSTRGLGMGDAYTAAVDDHSAIFYNPAALARRTEGQTRLMLRGALSNNFLPFLNDVEKASKKPTETEKINSFEELILRNYQNSFYMRAPTIGGFIARPHWGLAVIPLDLEVAVGIDRQVGPMVNVVGYGDTTIAFSYARDIEHLIGKDQRLSLGATVKAIHRLQIDKAVSAGELASNSKIVDTKDAQEGMTADVDLGVLYTPSVPTRGFFQFLEYMKPTIGFTARNIVNAGFFTNYHFIAKDSRKPDKLGRRFDIGTVWDLPNFWRFEPRFAADLRNMGADNWTFRKGMHFGVEFAWKMYGWWKGHWSAGVNQGYWTAGFGAKMLWFQLDAATYGEEIMPSARSQQSRRYMVEASLDF